MEAGGGRGCARHKDEVVPPEEHLHAADDRTTTLDRWRTLALLMGYKPTYTGYINHDVRTIARLLHSHTDMADAKCN